MSRGERAKEERAKRRLDEQGVKIQQLFCNTLVSTKISPHPIDK
jgi:hypothetical protein